MTKYQLYRAALATIAVGCANPMEVAKQALKDTRGRKRVSQDGDAIVAAHRSGWSDEKIAKIFHVHPSDIRAHISRYERNAANSLLR